MRVVTGPQARNDRKQRGGVFEECDRYMSPTLTCVTLASFRPAPALAVGPAAAAGATGGGPSAAKGSAASAAPADGAKGSTGAAAGRGAESSRLMRSMRGSAASPAGGAGPVCGCSISWKRACETWPQTSNVDDMRLTEGSASSAAHSCSRRSESCRTTGALA